MKRLTRTLAQRLAAAVAAGAWTPEGIAASAVRLLGPGEARLAARLADDLAREPYPPPPDRLARLIAATRGAGLAAARLEKAGIFPAPPLDAPQMATLAPFADLQLPSLATPGELAEWAGLTAAELDWFADPEERLARPAAARFRHYIHRPIAKKRGGWRMIEAPLVRLKDLQRKVLQDILSPVPGHPAAYGFVRGRNCISAAAMHAGEEVVACFDLASFFASVEAARVHAIFRCLGYPWSVARLLTGICTVKTPPDVLAGLPAPLRNGPLRRPHLPQGAPTSPALANLAAWGLDLRLAALARRMGATYTRYADDLTFSGDRANAFDRAAPLCEIVAEIALDEGFALNAAKTRIQRRSQRQTVTGIVVNAHVNLPRERYDRLKAVLHDCTHNGLAAANRSHHPAFLAHLESSVAWAESVNPRRGQRLRTMLDRIAGDAAQGA